jgi:hypothetical protein
MIPSRSSIREHSIADFSPGIEIEPKEDVTLASRKQVSRKPFLLRVPKELLDELRAWAAQDMRSLNGQIEYLLRDALRRRKKAERGEETLKEDANPEESNPDW